MFRQIQLRQLANFAVVVLAFSLYLWNFGNLGKDPAAADYARQFQVKDVDLAQAKTLLDAGALVIDVRDAPRYQQLHIPGARALPLDDLKKQVPADLVEDKTKNILVYCGDGVAKGYEGTAILNRAGFFNAVNLHGGFEKWESAGLPGVR